MSKFNLRISFVIILTFCFSALRVNLMHASTTKSAINQLYLDEMDLTKGTCGWKTMRSKLSVGGNPIKIATVTYARGVGTHAPGEITIKTNGASRFTSKIGIDDETNGNGTVEFIVYGNQTIIYQSGIMRGNAAAKSIDLDISAYAYLRLIVTIADGSNNNDHADWADALLEYETVKPVCIKAAELPWTEFRNKTVHYALPNKNLQFRLNVYGVQPITVNVTNLPVGIEFDSKRNILYGKISQEGVYNIPVSATNIYGTIEKTFKIEISNKLKMPTPPMGWMTWNIYRGEISETKIKQTADVMVSSGMRDAGYNYIIIDDLWQGTRDASGKISPNATKFPSGIKALADYVHAIGLKLGIYSDAADNTCGGAVGSLNKEVIDAQTYASWGIDYLKYDYCNAPADQATAINRYKAMADALNNSGRDMVFAACEWGDRNPWEWAAEKSNAQLWRTTWDIRDTWEFNDGDKNHYGIMNSLDRHIGLEYYAGPNRWNDPDMMVVGLYGTGIPSNAFGANGCTDREYQANMSLWAMIAAPLITSFELKTINDATKDILLNKEVIAINQDTLGDAATRIFKDGDIEVWARDLYDGGKAVAFLNRNNTVTKNISVNWSNLFIEGSYDIRDLWKHQLVGTSNTSFNTNVLAHEVVLLKLSKVDNANAVQLLKKTDNWNCFVQDKHLKINYSQPENGIVEIMLADSYGKQVLLKSITNFLSDKITADFDVSNLPSGVYFCRLKYANRISTKKVIL